MSGAESGEPDREEEHSAGLYLDTSALGRILLGEPDAKAVRTELARWERHISSRLLALELRRLARREDLIGDAELLLGGLALVPLTEQTLLAADAIPPATVASLGAIHLATAVQLREAKLIDAAITYDDRLATGLEHHEIEVLAPAPDPSG